MDKDFTKHPLAQIMGAMLAKDRGGRKSVDLAKRIQCAPSTYRLAESGNLSLNPTLALRLSQVNDYSFTPLLTLLVAIAVSNDALSIAEARNTLRAIGDADDQQKFGHLLDKLGNELWIFAQNRNPDEVKAFIEDKKLHHIMKDYLKNPDFGKSVEEVLENDDKILRNKILTLPSIYNDFVTNFIDKTDELPVRVRFSDLGKWEQSNLQSFKRLSALVNDYKTITNFENLKRYRYNYLWEETFIEANFIFISEHTISPQAIIGDFQTNMEVALNDIGDTYKLKNLDRAMQKINVRVITNDNSNLCKQILTGKNYDGLRDNATTLYDAFWVFTRLDRPPVGFLAFDSIHKDIQDYIVYVEGVSLNGIHTAEKSAQFQSLWKNTLITE